MSTDFGIEVQIGNQAGIGKGDPIGLRFYRRAGKKRHLEG